MNTQRILCTLGAAILSACAYVAGMPDSISNQIPQFFPQQYRGYIGFAFAMAAFTVLHFKKPNQQTEPVIQPQAGAVQPVIKP